MAKDKALSDELKRIEAKGRRLKIDGVEIDLKPSTPITMGDTEALESVGVKLVSSVNLTESSANLKKYIGHFIRKVKADVTEEQLASLPAWQVMASVRYIQVESAEPPDPN